jgi:hypothetical protein
MDDPLSPELEALSLLALAHGFDSVSDGRRLERFVVGELEFERSLEAAQQSIASGRADISRYAIAWDGFVTEPGRRPTRFWSRPQSGAARRCSSRSATARSSLTLRESSCEPALASR